MCGVCWSACVRECVVDESVTPNVGHVSSQQNRNSPPPPLAQYFAKQGRIPLLFADRSRLPNQIRKILRRVVRLSHNLPNWGREIILKALIRDM